MTLLLYLYLKWSGKKVFLPQLPLHGKGPVSQNIFLKEFQTPVLDKTEKMIDKYGAKIADGFSTAMEKATPVAKDEIITIYRLDGMYCNGSNSEGERVYINASTEVEIVE